MIWKDSFLAVYINIFFCEIFILKEKKRETLNLLLEKMRLFVTSKALSKSRQAFAQIWAA